MGISVPKSLAGLGLALGLPGFAIFGPYVSARITDIDGAILLMITPWLVLGWVLWVERLSLGSIGLRRADRPCLG
jgi:hypothetical protein